MAFREALKFGIPPLVLAVIAAVAGWHLAAGILVLATAFVFYFFRDPERRVPQEPGAVVSPADGRVVEITEETFNGRPGNRISIFLSIFNVHVNRAPVAGRIESVEYRPGKFYAAMRARASVENEQNVFRLETARGPVVVKQIAGWVARRVLAWKRVGATLDRGERLGMIRFGSRVDLWLPAEARIVVSKGQTVQGGSSIVAQWS
jgi:phosphatidylserine decarboxylase